MSIIRLNIQTTQRNLPSGKPLNADIFNDTSAEVATDFASIATQWNNSLQPLLSLMPDGSQDTLVNGYDRGLDGFTFYVDARATNAITTIRYYNTTRQRPKTLIEVLDDLYSLIPTAGSAGSSTAAGFKGEKGDRGAPGIQGQPGPQGLPGSSGSGANAFFLVNQDFDTPTNAINLSTLGNGVLEQTVASGIATITAANISTQRIPFGTTSGTLTTDSAFIYNAGVLNIPNLKITGLGATSGFLIKDAAGNITLDNNTYLSAAAAAATYETIVHAASTYQVQLTSATGPNLISKFIVQGLSDSGLPNAQFLGALPTGFLKVATTTGILTSDTSTYITQAYTTIKDNTNTLSTQRSFLKFTSQFTLSDDGTNTVVALTNTGVTAGSYTNSNITVDAFGRITSAATGSGAAADNAFYVVAKVDNAPVNAINIGTLSSGFLKITTSGGLASFLTDPSTYITQAYSTILTNATPVTQRSVVNFSNSFSTVDNPGSTRTDIDLTSTGVVPGSYLTANIVVDAKGRITSVASGVSGSPTNATYITQTPDPTLTNEQALSLLGSGLLKNATGTGILSIATPGVEFQAPLSPADTTISFPTANTIKVDLLPSKFIVQGTSDTALPNAQFLGALPSGFMKVTTGTGVITSDATTYLSQAYTSIKNSSNTVSTQRSFLKFTAQFALADDGTNTVVDLATTGVTPGSYANTNLTVDAFGRITFAAPGSGAAPDNAFYVVNQLTNAPINAINLGLLSTGFLKITTTSGVANVFSDPSTYITQAYSTIKNSGTSLTQRSIFNFSNNFAVIDNSGSTRTDIELSATGASGSYTNASLTVDTWGRITAASSGIVAPLTDTFITQTPSSTLTNEQALSLLGNGLLKNATGTGILSIANSNIDFPDPHATYVVTSNSNIPPNAVNLGLLSSGFLKVSVTSGVASFISDPSTYLVSGTGSAGTYQVVTTNSSGQVISGIPIPAFQSTIIYFIDNDSGNDFNTGVTSGSPLKTLEELNNRLPLNGNQSTLVVLCKPRSGGITYLKKDAVTEDDISFLNRLTNYSKVLVRGSDLTNNAADKLICGAQIVSGTNAGGYNPTGTPTAVTFNCQLNGGGAASLSAEPALSGKRVRFSATTATTALQNVARMIWKNTNASVSVSLATSVAPSTSDIFYIEEPGFAVNNINLNLLSVSSNGTIYLVGIRAPSNLSTISSTSPVQLSFCDISNNRLTFLNFATATTTNFYFDETNAIQNTGGNRLNSLSAARGMSGSFSHFSLINAGNSTAISSIQSLSFGSGGCSIASITISGCGSGAAPGIRFQTANCSIGNLSSGNLSSSQRLRIHNATSEFGLIIGCSSRLNGIDISNSLSGIAINGNNLGISFDDCVSSEGGNSFNGISCAYAVGSTFTFGLQASNSIAGGSFNITTGSMYLFGGQAGLTFSEMNNQLHMLDTSDNAYFFSPGVSTGGDVAYLNPPTSLIITGAYRTIIHYDGTNYVQAQADTLLHSANVIGVALHSATGTAGSLVSTSGMCYIQCDSAATIGSPVYLSSTVSGNGTFTIPSIAVFIGTCIGINSADNTVALVRLGLSAQASSGATSHYIVNQSEPTLINSINLGALSSGLLKQTVSSGIATLAVANLGTDYVNKAYATIDAAGTPLTQRSILNFAAAFAATDNSGSSRTDVDLTTQGLLTPGSYTNANITVNNKGIITVAGNGSSGGGGGITQLTGDVTAGPGSGSLAATIPASTITLAQMADLATSHFIGRISAGTGAPESLAASNAWTILGIEPAANFPALTGDVTTTAGSLTTTIANNAVTFAKMQTIANQTILGNNSGATAVPAALTATQVRTLLGLAAIATSGSANDLVSGTLPAGRFPALTGDITTIAGTLATTLKNTGPGITSATNANISIDAQGRVTALSNGSGGGSGADALGSYIVQTSAHAPINSQVLASLGSGFVKVTTGTGVLSTDLTTYQPAFSLTSGSVLFSAGGSTIAQDNPNFNYNDTTNVLNINSIDIIGGGTTALIFTQAAQQNIEKTNGLFAIGTHDSNKLQLYTNSNTRAEIDQSGNIRIQNIPYIGFTDGSTLAPSDGTVVDWKINPPNQASGVSTKLDAHVWKQLTATFTGTAIHNTLTSGVNMAHMNGPILAHASAGGIIDFASTLAISEAPSAGTNTTITNSYALWVQSNSIRLDGHDGSTNAAIKLGSATDQAIVKSGGNLNLTTSDSHNINLLINNTVLATFNTSSIFDLVGHQIIEGAAVDSFGTALLFNKAADQAIIKTGGTLFIGTSSSNVLEFVTNGSSRGFFDTTGNLNVGTILPTSDATYNLGSSTQQWVSLFAAVVVGNTTSHILTLKNNTSDATHLSLNAGNIAVKGGMAPETTLTYDLGNSTNLWSTVWTETILGDTGGLLLQDSNSGNTAITLSNTAITTKGNVQPLINGTNDLGGPIHVWNHLYTNNIVAHTNGVLNISSAETSGGTGGTMNITCSSVTTGVTAGISIDPINARIGIDAGSTGAVALNISSGVPSFGGQRVCVIWPATTAPTSNPNNNSVILYVDPSTGSLKARTASGITTLAV